MIHQYDFIPSKVSQVYENEYNFINHQNFNSASPIPSNGFNQEYYPTMNFDMMNTTNEMNGLQSFEGDSNLPLAATTQVEGINHNYNGYFESSIPYYMSNIPPSNATTYSMNESVKRASSNQYSNYFSEDLDENFEISDGVLLPDLFEQEEMMNMVLHNQKKKDQPNIENQMLFIDQSNETIRESNADYQYPKIASKSNFMDKSEISDEEDDEIRPKRGKTRQWVKIDISKIVPATREERNACILKYKSKRECRVSKKIRYMYRQQLASKRRRWKGKFVTEQVYQRLLEESKREQKNK